MTDRPTRPPSQSELAAVREFEQRIKEAGEQDARLELMLWVLGLPIPEWAKKS